MRISDWSSDVCSSDLFIKQPRADRRCDIPFTGHAPAIGQRFECRALHTVARRQICQRDPPGIRQLPALWPGKRGGSAVLEAARQCGRQDLARKSVVEGKRVSVRVDLGGPRIIKKKKKNKEID